MISWSIIIGFVSVLLGALGQIFLKYGLGHIDFEIIKLFDLRFVLQIVNNGWIPFGIVMYAVSLLFWLEALSKGEISQLYPMIGLNFVILSIVGYLLFHEQIGLLRICGLLLIVFGIVIISRS